MTIEARHAKVKKMVEAAVDPTRQAYSAEEIMAEVRAAMRIVLEEATEYDSNHPVEQTQGRLWCCKYHMLLAEINALGANDGD